MEETKEKKKNIYETINLIMMEVPAIGKNKKNPKQNYNFRSIDDVMNKLQPLFAKFKLFVTPEILEHTREERRTSAGGVLLYSICKIKYTFYAEDGSSVETIVIGEGMDSGDKASNKAMAVALKYALFQVFCIPTEELKDPDNEKVPQTISSQEYMKLMIDFKDLLIHTNSDAEKIFEYFTVKNETEMSAEQLQKAVVMLKTKFDKQKQQNLKEVF
jgi:hypothetical protein